eukprot:CAMPEP_0177245766 /NCGR_PEP_ID=MMETSP0367-20130122/50639_1 /TAXON_ID=447022 ORGANISM="Scrippsiella hangoei-like, Strain SHHI-4" /NCGR_SAMPLE_ID=MMETSP0367 /ASSEMBLY_ACC=CAM_ASM_000362 /LENGTH=54 /DNA_ID=CAMNT_0018697717 /DNA_START=217 /DNA_END=381 /DNA_ORIENTATION=-
MTLSAVVQMDSSPKMYTWPQPADKNAWTPPMMQITTETRKSSSTTTSASNSKDQ